MIKVGAGETKGKSQTGTRKAKGEEKDGAMERLGKPAQQQQAKRAVKKVHASGGVEESRGESVMRTSIQQVGGSSRMHDVKQAHASVAQSQAENRAKVFVVLSPTLLLFVSVLSWLWFTETVTHGPSVDHESVECVCWSETGDCDARVQRGKKTIVTVRCTESDLKGRTGVLGDWPQRASHCMCAWAHGSRETRSGVVVLWLNFVPKVEERGRIFLRLPGEVEAKQWLINHSRFWCTHPNGCTDEFFDCEPNIIQPWLGRPEPLAPCSKTDEERLYAEAFKSPFNVSSFKALAAKVKDQVLVKRVVDGLEFGHVSRFSAPGLDAIFLDFTKPSKSSVGLFKATTLQAYRDAGGYVVGPFNRPPFPNSVNKNQPSINHSFDIPKDRWKEWQPGMSRRFIIHGSDPEFISYNALQPRQAADRPYYTPAKHHSKTARAGRNALGAMVDMRFCYLNFVSRLSEWHRQCVLDEEGQFYVFPGGMFGSVSAGDIAHSFMTVVRDILHEVFHLRNVDIYCDNFDNITPALPSGEPDYARANREWKLLIKVLSELGIPLHEHVPPTRAWGCTNELGVDIDDHLGWGGRTFPTMAVWVPERKRVRLGELAKKWASLKKFDCSTIAKMVGIFMSLECVLKCLNVFLSQLVNWQTACEKRVRESASRLSRKSAIFPNGCVGRVLLNMVDFLRRRDWTVPLIDWEACYKAQETVVFADAAVPKEFGLAYSEGVWGKAAVSFSSKFFLASSFSSEVIDQAKRRKALSSPYLELENYVSTLISIAKSLKTRRILLVGDCKTALDWLVSCSPIDQVARALLDTLITAQLDLGFVFRVERRARSDKFVSFADMLSRNHHSHIQVLTLSGYRRVQYRSYQ